MTKEQQTWRKAITETQAVWQDEWKEYKKLRRAKIDTISREMAATHLRRHIEDCHICRIAEKVSSFYACEVCIVTSVFGLGCDKIEEYDAYINCISGYNGSKDVSELIDHVKKILGMLKKLTKP